MKDILAAEAPSVFPTSGCVMECLIACWVKMKQKQCVVRSLLEFGSLAFSGCFVTDKNGCWVLRLFFNFVDLQMNLH